MSENSSNTNYLNATKGIKSWLLTIDHKRIGVMYLISVVASLGLGGLAAILCTRTTRLAQKELYLVMIPIILSLLYTELLWFLCLIIPAIPGVF